MPRIRHLSRRVLSENKTVPRDQAAQINAGHLIKTGKSRRARAIILPVLTARDRKPASRPCGIILPGRISCMRRQLSGEYLL